MQLLKYDAAKAALQAARSFDEVTAIADKAAIYAELARRANDTEMIEWATEIRVRAERRAGQMLAEMEKAKGGRPKTGSPGVPVKVTLSEVGVSKKQSSRWQKLAAVPDDQFEKAVSAAKEVAGEVTQAAILRASTPPKEPKPKEISDSMASTLTEVSALRAEVENLREWGQSNADTAKELLSENATLEKVVNADDKLAAASAEIKKLKELNRIAEERIRGLMAEKNEAIKEAKRWRSKFEKAVAQA